MPFSEIPGFPQLFAEKENITVLILLIFIKTFFPTKVFSWDTVIPLILIRHSLFFLYANIFPSEFEPLFGLSRDTLFAEYFEAVHKTRSTCFIGIKTLGYASCFYTPIKQCCWFFKHYINDILHMRQKYAGIFVCEHFLSFSRKQQFTVKLRETVGLKPNAVYCVYYPSNIFRNKRELFKN